MQVTRFSAIATKEKIDAENGIIHGVAVITKGDAQTHGLVIDETMLSQVAAMGALFADGLKVRMNHPTKGATPEVQGIVGSLRNFRVEDDKARADLHLLKSDAHYAKVMELAQKMPEAFGLSIVFSGVPETKDTIKFARCTEIYACDLVDAPAANPTGLFSKNPETHMIDLKFLSKLVGLPETATEAEVVTAFEKTRIAPDLTALAKATEVTELTKQVTALQTAAANATALAKKSELDNLIAEASREGKVIPLDVADIYSVKDGVVTIHTEPAMLSKMLSKITKTVSLAKKATELPKNKDGKVLEGEERIEFCRQKQAEGAQTLSEHFKRSFGSLATQN